MKQNFFTLFVVFGYTLEVGGKSRLASPDADIPPADGMNGDSECA